VHLTLLIQEAITNISSFKLRSFLTSLGVLVGTASVVALLSGGELATQEALTQFKDLGTNLLAINIEQPYINPSQNLSNSIDLPFINKLTTHLKDISEAAPYTTYYSSAIFDGQKIDGGTLGVTEELKKISKLQLQHGRFISNLDNSQPYCVLGSEIAATITDNNNSSHLINKQILIGNYFFTIIGILRPTPHNMFLHADINKTIMIPIKTSLFLYKNAAIRNIIFELNSTAEVNSAQNNISQMFTQYYPNTKLLFMNPEQIIANMEKQNKTFTLLLGFIGAISLIVGGIGVMNIMLVSVAERRREIGIRLAVGATKNEIQYLFLTEAIVLTLIGGLIGIGVGELVAYITAKLSHWTFQFFIIPLLMGFTISIVSGIFFGFYPARKASQLSPIDALRTA
jgi:putative ABC transport system permease protein